MGLFSSKVNEPKNSTKHGNSSSTSTTTTTQHFIATIAKAVESPSVGNKITLAYDLIRQLDEQANNQTNQILIAKIRKANEDMYEFLHLTEEYVTEFQPYYEALEDLQTNEWKSLSKEEFSSETKSFLLNGKSPSLLESIVEKTTDFTEKLNSIVVDIAKINDEVMTGNGGSTDKNIYLIAFGLLLVAGGIVCAVLPIAIPMEAVLITSFLSAGGGIALTGAGLIAYGAFTRAQLENYSIELKETSSKLRDLLAELHPTVKDHQKIAKKLLILSEQGVFHLENATKMCQTFNDLEKAFRSAINRRAGLTNREIGTSIVSGIAGASFGFAAATALTQKVAPILIENRI